MEIVRRPTRLPELPVHPQLVRYLAQAGEFFAVVAEGTEYERVHQAVTLHQLELCTRCLTSGRLQPAKLVLDTAASDETRISVLLSVFSRKLFKKTLPHMVGICCRFMVII